MLTLLQVNFVRKYRLFRICPMPVIFRLLGSTTVCLLTGVRYRHQKSMQKSTKRSRGLPKILLTPLESLQSEKNEIWVKSRRSQNNVLNNQSYTLVANCCNKSTQTPRYFFATFRFECRSGTWFRTPLSPVCKCSNINFDFSSRSMI